MKLFALAFVFALGASSQAGAQDVLSDQSLDSERGGFVTAGGLTVGFGAEVRTYVDGALALESRLTWEQNGPEISSATGTGMTAGGAAPSVLLPGAGGVTTVIHDFTDGQIRNIVANTASDRSIFQNTDVTIVLPGFDQMQQSMQQQRLVSGLESAVGLALRDAAAR